MAGLLQPLASKFKITNDDGTPTDYFIRWAQQKQIDISGGLTQSMLEDYITAHPLQAGSGISITPDGKLSSNPTISAIASAILDQISTTHGTVLFRGNANWQGLGPGTSGQFLKTNGAGADPVWAAAGGGGGSMPERTRVIPLTSGFTLQNAGTATITDKTYGMEIRGPSVGTNIRFVRKNGAPPATPYTIILRGSPVNPLQNNGYHSGIILRNNTSGRILISGIYSGASYLIQQWTGYTTFNANVLAPVNSPMISSTPWQKLENDGTNLKWSLSPDGDDWYQIASTTLATFINGAGGTVDEIGMGILVNGANVVMNAQSFEVV